MTANDLPPGRLLSWYGDDFTGSAAVMEVLTFSGIPSVLFLDVPTESQLARFPAARAIGIAGLSRSQTPAWMDANLPPIFEAMAGLSAPITHLKICSTLDSSPEIGSVGRAVELANPILGSAWIPALVAAPPLGRWQAFGHLFATAGDGIFRLDRHPIMSRHPVTPMSESDVALHLSRQTSIATGCIDLRALNTAAEGDVALTEALARGEQLVTIDCIDDITLAAAGRLFWTHRHPRLLVVGSQGVEYTLLAYWRSIGALAEVKDVPGAGPVAQIAVVSGSVSPTTTLQMNWAAQNDFGLVRFDAAKIVDPATRAIAIEQALSEALAVLAGGRSVIVHSAAGLQDPALDTFRAAVSGSNIGMPEANALLGESLGEVLACLLRRTGLLRAVVSGGDTSGHATRQLGVEALTALAPTVPGAALCTAHCLDAAACSEGRSDGH